MLACYGGPCARSAYIGSENGRLRIEAVGPFDVASRRIGAYAETSRAGSGPSVPGSRAIVLRLPLTSPLSPEAGLAVEVRNASATHWFVFSALEIAWLDGVTSVTSGRFLPK